MNLLKNRLVTEFYTLGDLVRLQAQEVPHAKALTFNHESLTYRQLDQRSDRLANGLLALGIKPKSRVAILAKDSLKNYEIIFACAKIQAVVVPINWRLAPLEVSYILNDAEVELLFIGAEFNNLVKSITKDLVNIETFITLGEGEKNWLNYSNWSEQYSDVSPEITPDSNDIVVQLYTSGTTGRPKGVQLAHYSFMAIAKEFAKQNRTWIDWSKADKSLVALPSFHIGGLWWAICGLASGAENVLIETFVDVEVLEAISQYQITKMMVVPAMIQVLLAEPQCKQTDFSSLKYIVYGGSPIAEAVLKDAIAVFDCGFAQIYGMTETGNCAICLLPEAHISGNSNLLKSAGRAFPGVSVAVIDSDCNELPPYQIGEVRLKSPANMVGYWKLPEATAKTLIDGWIHTGDAGYIDEEGYLFICDRIKDMICYAGENVYPAEVENVLHEHPAVAEVGVIGVPDLDFGESIKALIVLKPQMDAKALEVINFVRGKIADFKLPRSIEFVESLPRTPSGKIQKGKLREKYWQDYQRRVN